MRNTIKILFALLFVSVYMHAQIDRTKMPAAGPTPSINLGEPETITLSNGLTVLFVENHKLPRVSVSLMLDNPPHAEGNKNGVGSLAASLIGNGSTNIDKDTFNEEVDFLGASLSLSAEGGYASSLSKYFERIVELMSDAALHPNFTEEELEKERKIIIEGLKQGEKSAASVASRVRDVLLYGKNHPYGEYTTEETVNNVTLADVKSYYNTYFVPSNAYMVVSGDFKTKDAKKLIKKYFGPWKKATAPKTTIAPAKSAQYLQIDFVDMPNAVQSELSILSPIDFKMTDKDYHAALVANYILGGAFNSYLNMNLREEHGYTYGARSSVSDDKWTTGEFSAATKIRNAVTDSAIVESLKEIKRITTTTVDETALENAKAKYLGSFIMATENPQTVARYAINIKTENLPEDFYKNFIANINAVTVDDVLRVSKKYFDLKEARIVVVGKGSEVLHNLEKIEFEEKTLPVNYFNKYGEKIDRPVFSKPIPEGVTAKTVIENYITAIGGKDAVEKVNTVSIVAKAEVQGMALDLTMKKTNKDQVLVDLALMGNSMSKQVLNKDKGYITAQGQTQEMDANMLADAKASAAPFPELAMLNDDTITLTAIESLNGKDVYVVKEDEKTNSYYDVATGLKVQEITTEEAQGQTFSQVKAYADYTDVKGVKFPFTIKQTMGPQELEFKVQELKVNEGVSDADFK